MRVGMFVLVGLLSTVLLISCSQQNNTNSNVIVEPEQENQPQETDKPVQVDEPEEVKGIETDPTVKAEFQELVSNKSDAVQLKSFVDRQAGKVSITDYSIMVVALEDAQEDQKMALEDRYYKGHTQEQLTELQAKGIDFTQYDQITDQNVRKLLEDTHAGGYKVVVADGAYLAHIDYETYEKYQEHVSEDIRDYIEIKQVQTNSWSIHMNAAVMIDWDNAVKLVIMEEEFIAKHSNSMRKAKVENLFANGVYLTFNGIESTPLFSYGDGLIVPEAKTAYSNAVQAGDTNSPYVNRLRTLLELIDKSDGKQSEEVKKFQSETNELWAKF